MGNRKSTLGNPVVTHSIIHPTGQPPRSASAIGNSVPSISQIPQQVTQQYDHILVKKKPSTLESAQRALLGNKEYCHPRNTGSITILLNEHIKCDNNMNGMDSLEVTSHSNPIVVNTDLANTLNFGLDRDRALNGIFVESISISKDTIVTLKITGHAGAMDPVINVDDVVYIRTADGGFYWGKTKNETYQMAIEHQSKENGIVTIQLEKAVKNLNLPELGFNKDYKLQNGHKYIYVLNEIIVQSYSKYIKEQQEKEKTQKVLQPVTTTGSNDKKTEHFRITDRISFDESDANENFKIYLLLLILFILIIVYLYKN